jgi:hypothetical protein
MASIVVLTDCAGDSVALAELSLHWATLTGSLPVVLPLPVALMPHEHIETTALASHALLRALEAATLHIGRDPHITGLALNGAPRDGEWPNGVPFCWFKFQSVIITAPFDPQVLRLVRRQLGVSHVELVDIEEVLRAAQAWGERLSDEGVAFIAGQKFRSLWFQPRFTLWLMEGGHDIPSTRLEIPVPVDDELVRVSFTDGFMNGFLNCTASELGFRAGDVVLVPRFGANGEVNERIKVRCVTDFTELELGEPGLILGYTFPMLIVKCGKAAEFFGMTHGQAMNLQIVDKPTYALNGLIH